MIAGKNRPGAGVPQVTQAPANTVIDLTTDEDDYSRALQLSMETSQSVTKFGPSERAPDPAWQMVTSNVSTAVLSSFNLTDLNGL